QEVRPGGLVPRPRPPPGSLLLLALQRLPGAPGQPPLPPRAGRAAALRPHHQRFRAGAYEDNRRRDRELPGGGRLDHRPRGVAALPRRPGVDPVTIPAGPTAEAIEQFNTGLSRFWHPVCLDDDLPLDAPLGVELLGRALVVVRLKGGLACFDDLCRHFGAALSIGEVVDGNLRCRYHGWTYDRAGKVVDIPARRDQAIPREACVESHQVEERYGLVWVCLAAEAAADIPAYPESKDPKYHRTPYREYKPWAA